MALRASAPAAAFRVAARRTPAVAARRLRRASAVRVEAAKRSVGDLTKADLEGKRVFVRCDLNVPLDKELNITDDTRIRAAVDTLKYLSDNGAKVIVTSHLVSFCVRVLCSLRSPPPAVALFSRDLGRDLCARPAPAAAGFRSPTPPLLWSRTLYTHPPRFRDRRAAPSRAPRTSEFVFLWALAAEKKTSLVANRDAHADPFFSSPVLFSPRRFRLKPVAPRLAKLLGKEVSLWVAHRASRARETESAEERQRRSRQRQRPLHAGSPLPPSPQTKQSPRPRAPCPGRIHRAEATWRVCGGLSTRPSRFWDRARRP